MGQGGNREPGPRFTGGLAISVFGPCSVSPTQCSPLMHVLHQQPVRSLVSRKSAGLGPGGASVMTIGTGAAGSAIGTPVATTSGVPCTTTGSGVPCTTGAFIREVCAQMLRLFFSAICDCRSLALPARGTHALA